MDVLDIIDNYYKENGPLRSILLTHSKQVAEKSLSIIRVHPEFSIDQDLVYEMAMLHDIGSIRCDAKDIHCYGAEPYICHGLCGAEMLRSDGWERYFPRDRIEKWMRVCERHISSGLTREDIQREHLPLPPRDFLPETLEEKLVCYADKFYSKTRLQEEKSVERVVKQMKRYSTPTMERFLALHELFG